MDTKTDRTFAGILLLAALVYFSNLGGTSIYILDEAKNAACAMEMMDRNDFIAPTFNGALRTDKPPLHYYFMMASYKVFGVTPFAARFFSSVSGLILLAVVYINVKRLIGKDAAIYSALALLSSVQLTVQFHLAVPDPYLILLLTLALFGFFNGFHFNPRHMYLFYVSVAFAFLTKGLIAIVLPGLIIVLYLLTIGQLNLDALEKLKVVAGGLLFCGIALPWYVAVGIVTEGEWLEGFFIAHNMNRYTSTMEGHRGFPGAPFLILWVALLPFSVFIIQALKLALGQWKDKKILLFCMIVCLSFALFFSFSQTLLPTYPAPAIPFLAILLGNWLANWVNGTQLFTRGVTASLGLNILLAVIIPVAGYFVLAHDPQLAGIRHISMILAVLPLGSALSCFYFSRHRYKTVIHLLAGSWVALAFLFFYVACPVLDRKNPVSESLNLLAQKDSIYQIVGYKQFNPAYVFNLRRVIEVIESPEEIMARIKYNEKMIIVTFARHLEDLPEQGRWKVIYRGRDLFESNETVLVSN